MNTINNLTASDKSSVKDTAVALGLFDGMHLGHRMVIGKALGYSEYGLLPTVFTFATNSVKIKHKQAFRYIADNELKLKMMKNMGVDNIYCPDFSEIKELSAEEFVRDILCGRLCAKKVICGYAFRFGKKALGGIDELHTLGLKYGFEAVCIPPVYLDGSVISSTAIRKYIAEGNILQANKLLGYNYVIGQVVSHGLEIGRTIDFPTINQKFGENQLIPHFGVYASQTFANGKKYPSVTNIGIKPTVGVETEPLAETHILDFSGDLYGKEISVELIDFIRPERKFSSLDELRKAIANDVRRVKAGSEH